MNVFKPPGKQSLAVNTVGLSPLRNGEAIGVIEASTGAIATSQIANNLHRLKSPM